MIYLQVNHSQRLNDPQLKPWVVVAEDGQVKGAHCNCVAGLGEACSHIGSILFYLLELVAKKEETVSVTSKKCRWSQPSRESLKKVDYAEGRNIIFNNSQRIKKRKVAETDAQHGIPPLNDNEATALYSSLAKCTGLNKKLVKPAILSLISGHADAYIPSIVTLDLPKPLTALYDADNRKLDHPQLLEKCEETFKGLCVTAEQVLNI